MVKKKVVTLRRSALRSFAKRRAQHIDNEITPVTSSPPSPSPSSSDAALQTIPDITPSSSFLPVQYKNPQSGTQSSVIVNFNAHLAPGVEDGPEYFLSLRDDKLAENEQKDRLIKQLEEEGPAALKLLLWAVQHHAVGASGRRVQGTEERVERLHRLLSEHGVGWDALKMMSAQKRLLLFARLKIGPTERVWLAALCHARPCGAIILSQDGKHICLRRTAHDTPRCDNPYHQHRFRDRFEDGIPIHEDHPSSNSISTGRYNKTPLQGSHRAEVRQFYGQSIYPTREIHTEAAISERVQARYGPESNLDNVGPVVELVEMVNDISEKHSYLGSDPHTVGGDEDTARALDAWSYITGDSNTEMVRRYKEKQVSQYSDPARTYEMWLLRAEFNKGGPGEYRTKVVKRRDEWLVWLGRVQRILHTEVEKCHLKQPLRIQPVAPPSIETMQRAVENKGGGQGVAGTSRSPFKDPYESDPLFRPIDPSRGVQESDIYPAMPTIIVEGTVSLNDKKKKYNAGDKRVRVESSLALTLRLLVNGEACFVSTERLARNVYAKFKSLPLPPAMVPFSLAFRVDPLHCLEEGRQDFIQSVYDQVQGKMELLEGEVKVEEEGGGSVSRVIDV